MENKKYLDSGEVTQYNEIKKEYKLTKEEYKKEKARLNKAQFNNYVEQYGSRMCVITSAVTSGVLLTAGYTCTNIEAMVFGSCLGVTTAGIGIASYGISEDRHQEIKEIKEKKKVLKREYKRKTNN